VEKGAPTRRIVTLNDSFLSYKGITRTKQLNYYPMQKRGVASKKSFLLGEEKGRKGRRKRRERG